MEKSFILRVRLPDFTISPLTEKELETERSFRGDYLDDLFREDKN